MFTIAQCLIVLGFATPYRLYLSDAPVSSEFFGDSVARTEPQRLTSERDRFSRAVDCLSCTSCLGRAKEDSSQVGHMEWSFATIEEENKAPIGKG